MTTQTTFITRDWLLKEIPLRKLERAVSLHLIKNNHAPVLEAILRKGHMLAGEHVGVADIDMDLGKFHVHEMEKDNYYVEAVYNGEIDVDVNIQSEGLSLSDERNKSFMLDIEATVEIDVQNRKLVSFEVLNVEIF